MRALVYTAPRGMDVRDWEDPEPRPGEVLVRVRAAAICGSDLHGYLGHSKIRVPPMIMGHEFAGEIAALGSQVSGLAVGNRVTAQPVVGCALCAICRSGYPNACPDRRLLGGHLPGAFADAIAVPAAQVYLLPDAVSFAQAALTEPLANGVHMVHLAPAPFADVVVIGAGTLGLMTLQAYRSAGARRVIAVDTVPERLRTAQCLGAAGCVQAGSQDVARAVGDLLVGEFPAVVVDAVGHTATRRQAMQLVAPRGTVVLLGLAEPESTLDVLGLINREVRLQGSYASRHGDVCEALDLIASGRVDVTSWATLTTLDRGPEVFAQLVDDPGSMIKAVFMMDGNAGRQDAQGM